MHLTAHISTQHHRLSDIIYNHHLAITRTALSSRHSIVINLSHPNPHPTNPPSSKTLLLNPPQHHTRLRHRIKPTPRNPTIPFPPHPRQKRPCRSLHHRRELIHILGHTLQRLRTRICAPNFHGRDDERQRHAACMMPRARANPCMISRDRISACAS